MTARVRFALAACSVLAACGQVVQYTDELVDPRTGRSSFVTVPANAGGFVGFVAGIPVDAAALPVSWPVYEVQKSRSPDTADPISTMLFPSFVLWRAGSMVAMPFDAMEWVVWRAWQPPTTRTAEEQAQIEYDLDEETLPRYPVEPIYPPPLPEDDGDSTGR